jgi:tRNA-specific 2-thiouridylase
VVDAGGALLGEHGGSAGFTIGQRRGVGVTADTPRYVSRIDPLTNTIQLGRREDLETRHVPLSGVTFVADSPPGGRPRPFRATVQIRHRAAEVPATVRPVTPAEPRRGGRWTVETDSPVWAAAPGQAAVLYDGDVVLGGGRIERPEVIEAA